MNAKRRSVKENETASRSERCSVHELHLLVHNRYRAHHCASQVEDNVFLLPGPTLNASVALTQ